MKRFAVVIIIFSIVYVGTDFFSVRAISAPLLDEISQPASQDAYEALSQPYHYLARGRQAYAFVSADGKWVLKFFNQKYFRLPFWAAIFPREREKRERRKEFYLDSYRIAAKMLKEETGIIYLHQGLSLSRLPYLTAIDKAGRSHRINLNEIPFVLQRRADPFYLTLKALPSEALHLAIGQFLSVVAVRIDHKIGDGDHDVENNFGMLEDKVIHLDPGRLYVEEGLWEPERLKYEWWSATHQFRKWLEKNYPDRLTAFDNAIETHLQRVLQQ